MIVISLVANIILTTSFITTSSELKHTIKRNETLEAGLLEVKAKEAIRESEIANWQRLTNEKQKILNEETAKRIEAESKLLKSAKKSWDSKNFTGDAKADIGILRDHALKIKEVRND